MANLIELICIDMSEQDNIDRVWDMIEKVGVCKLITQFASGGSNRCRGRLRPEEG
jgi:hypothetical protein